MTRVDEDERERHTKWTADGLAEIRALAPGINEAQELRRERDAALARVGELTEALATARDDTLEEAALLCAQNSGEVGRFVAAKGRVGDFFAMVLRGNKTEEGPTAIDLLQRFADAAGCPDADGFGSIIERVQRWRDAIYASHKVVLSDQGDHCGVCGADVEGALDDGLVCPGAKIVRAGTGETSQVSSYVSRSSRNDRNDPE